MSELTTCYHCGLPIGQAVHFQAQVLGELRSFCCLGCQLVAETIVSSGLNSYYQQRSDKAINPNTLPKVLEDELALYDRPDVQQEFVARQESALSVCLLVEGITCAACGWLIERHLRSLVGVYEARLNLSNHRLYLRWEPHQHSLSNLIAELRRIGYVAYPYQPDQATERMAYENRRALRQIGVAGLLWMQVMMASMATWPEFNLDLSVGMDRILRWTALILTTPIVFYCCADFFRGAVRDLRTSHLSMDVSVSLAIAGAYIAGLWSSISGQGELYVDTVGMFALLLLTGRYLERRARERTAEATTQLVKLLPASCLKLDEQGLTQRVLLTEVQVGDRILVPPGNLIPVDGRIIQGQSCVDESLLTGEYLPLARQAGDSVTAGTLNIESPLTLNVEALGNHTRLSAIVQLLERAQSEKPKLAEIADRVAQWFLISMLCIAAIVGLIWWQLDSSRVLWIVLALLVATCPCALSLATPMALTTATGTLHRLGLLITRGHVLEGLNRIDTLVLDKTGTLTEGRLTLESIQPLAGLNQAQCLALASALEQHSEHPIARAFGQSHEAAHQVQSYPGFGLQGMAGNQVLRIGQPQFAAALYGRNPPEPPTQQGLYLLLANPQGPLAWFLLEDSLRPEASELIHQCKQQGWTPILLSGDRSPRVQEVAQSLGITQAEGNLPPSAKLAYVQRLQAQGHRVLMLGDGVNDAPVLAAADISVAMGSGADLAKITADMVLLSNHLSRLPQAFKIAQKTRRIIIENILWACAYNAVVLPFAALGWITPLWAALGMSLSSLLVVLNALRLSRLPDVPRSSP
ncbi:Cu2+-exporting ATPase [Azomonas agilis]|uniref:Cu2+-exporting ATPase n=1 Tax=Azomonas agilis TaxID=116849 RepID=A0A562J138_9GAMM|nr:heavy metal translocating P-type ATPase [Azomonas agilis]TWH76843.1 Cu2+-exporting ATPase [Azomonas agilis]